MDRINDVACGMIHPKQVTGIKFRNMSAHLIQRQPGLMTNRPRARSGNRTCRTTQLSIAKLSPALLVVGNSACHKVRLEHGAPAAHHAQRALSQQTRLGAECLALSPLSCCFLRCDNIAARPATFGSVDNAPSHRNRRRSNRRALGVATCRNRCTRRNTRKRLSASSRISIHRNLDK